MNMIFEVLGKPQGKGRPRFSTVNGHAIAYTPAATKDYENAIRTVYQSQCGEKFDGPVSVVITADFDIPKSTKASDKEAMLKGWISPTKKPDADNIAKIVLDALNGIAYNDDAQVVELTVRKRYSEIARITVQISEE